MTPARARLRDLPRPPVVLGFAGLLPFLAGATGAWILPTPWDRFAVDLLLFYAACILSFLGAVHWGLALAGVGSRPPAEGDTAAHGVRAAALTWRRLGWSVVPALVAWIALALAPHFGLLVMILGFAGMFWGDLRAIAAGLAPPWYRHLRRPLTAAVILCLGAALLALILSAPPAAA